MRLNRFIFTCVLAVPFYVLSSFSVFAADPVVTVSQDVTIDLPTIGRSFTLRSSSDATGKTDALDSVSVNTAGTAFTFVTALTVGTVTVVSAEGIDMGGSNNSLGLNLTSCDSSGSKLKITANTSTVVTVTVTPPANTICNGTGDVQAAVSTGSGGVSPSVPSTPADSTTVPLQDGPAEEALTFTDVSSTQAKDVYALVNEMLRYKTYAFPKSKKYGVAFPTKGGFAVQTALAVSGKNCGSDKAYPGVKACGKVAIANKLITNKFPTGKVTRSQYYELLLKALGVTLESATVADLRKECSDVRSATKKQARVFMTAQALGIAPKYKGNKCLLNSGFSKYDAAKFAVRAMNAKGE